MTVWLVEYLEGVGNDEDERSEQWEFWKLYAVCVSKARAIRFAGSSLTDHPEWCRIREVELLPEIEVTD